METMPYQPELDRQPVPFPASDAATTGWQHGLPVLTGRQATLRELRASDAPSLFALLTTEEVTRFISPPPASVEGFERFIAWAARQRTAGTYACFAVTLRGSDTAVGIFQLRELEAGFGLAEWGFAIGSPYWGTGLFQEAAALVVNFAFDTVGVRRLEARAAVKNGRGTGALLKLGAVPEATLRQSFWRHEQYLDQVLYALVDVDWRKGTTVEPMPSVLVH